VARCHGRISKSYYPDLDAVPKVGGCVDDADMLISDFQSSKRHILQPKESADTTRSELFAEVHFWNLVEGRARCVGL